MPGYQPQSQMKNTQDDSLDYTDFGADLGVEFLENPGTLFWMVDTAYRGIEAFCCRVSEAVTRRHKI